MTKEIKKSKQRRPRNFLTLRVFFSLSSLRFFHRIKNNLTELSRYINVNVLLDVSTWRQNSRHVVFSGCNSIIWGLSGYHSSSREVVSKSLKHVIPLKIMSNIWVTNKTKWCTNVTCSYCEGLMRDVCPPLFLLSLAKSMISSPSKWPFL